jgi:hypothetical protein
MVAKLNIRIVIALGVLIGLLYGILSPETFTSYRAQSVVINGATNPMTDAEIEKTLGVDKYLPAADEDDNENTNE